MSKFVREWLAILLVYVGVLGLFGFTWSVSEQSRDQFCTTVERQHKIDVEGLARTYDYLETVDPTDLDSPLNVAILRGLKASEARAQTDPAPPLCDGRSIFHGELGEPEPDPKIPQRPSSLERIDES